MRASSVLFPLLLGLALCGPRAHAQPAADVPVERVILFTSGVGYFEHAGRVAGDAEVTLQFDESALNDVLKSLLVEDPQGRVAGVVYPSQAPVERTLRSFAIDLSGSPDLAAILQQARGAEVIVEAPGGTLRGTILAVGSEPPAAPGQAPERTLTLATAGGLATVRLGEARRIAFVDASLQAEIDGALAALAEARGGQRRPVRIQFRGGGPRRVRMGYVVEAPVWRTSYRLVLPDAGEATGTLQGWALVENPTESDWAGVDLTLVSGRPVSFQTDLYTPRYVQRPFVSLPDDAVTQPRTYDEGARFIPAPPPPPPASAPVLQGGLITNDAIGQARVVTGQDLEQLDIRGGRAENAEYYSDGLRVSGQSEINLGVGFQPQATSGDFGELFAYRLRDVTLPRRASAMLPIVAEGITAERLSVYDGGAGRHPMRGVRLRNSTGNNLRGGPVTVLDDGYAGDALLPDLTAGTQRLLTFAVDQDVLVDPFAIPDAPGTVETATLRDGVLVIRRQALVQGGYRVENRGERPRTVLVERARQQGARLDAPAAAEETTPAVYRFRVDVAAGEVDTLIVREARTYDEGIVLYGADPDYLASFVRADGAIPEDVRRAVEEAVDRRRTLAETERQIAALDREVQTIENDQSRIRGNLQSVDAQSDYARRLLRTLDEQETRLEAIRGERTVLLARAEEQRQALRVTVR
ncbi:MAG TPA: hypothetical protein VGB53_06290 [Rubricoccaceae bacterium]|jgi:hypothetical protein